MHAGLKYAVLICFLYSLVALSPLFSLGATLVEIVYANVTDLIVTSCDLNDAASSTCNSAINADGGTSFAIGKGAHIDAPFQTLTSSSITSATLYYDSWGTLSGTWAITVSATRDGTTLCTVDPAPEDATETNNSTSCTISSSQLAAGVWLRINNNDTAAAESVNIDYVRLNIDYVPQVAISLTTNGSVGFGILPLGSTQDTTSSGINDVETVQIDTGPADLDVRSGNFTEGGNTWGLSTTNGANQVKWEFSNDGSAWTTFAVADTLYTLDTNVAQSATRNLYLRLTMPTSTVSYSQYSSSVTIVASAP